MATQKLFTRSFTEKMRDDLQKGINLNSYLKEDSDFPDNSTLSSSIEVAEKPPILIAEVSDDINNAIKVYNFLGKLDKTQASDKRLWVYLSHLTFRKYTMHRWEIRIAPDVILKNRELQRRAINYILEHWFVTSNDRSMRRHSISRLWWAARLTVAPWEEEPQYFAELENNDRYIFTRTLFSTQDIYLQTLERGLGRSNHILIAILEYFRQNPGVAEDRQAVRSILKELNLMLGYRNLAVLELKEILKVIDEIAKSI